MDAANAIVASNGLGKLRGQQGGGVGVDDGALGQVLRELGVERHLLLHALCHGLDHQVRVAKGLVPVSGELDVRVGRLDLGLRVLAALRGHVLARHEAVRVGGRALLHGVERLELRLAAADGGLRAQPNGDVVSAVRALERNLASQHAAAGDGYLLDVHAVPFLRHGRVVTSAPLLPNGPPSVPKTVSAVGEWSFSQVVVVSKMRCLSCQM